jgi:alcohol dehydrogenase class IV
VHLFACLQVVAAAPAGWQIAKYLLRVPHGRANALLMTHVVAWNADYHGLCDTDAARKYAMQEALCIFSRACRLSPLRQQVGR